ncbi:MAG: galactose-1-phosphate uridylyltransferase [Chloroflexota bacterium]|nr:galactose-1-phosphate uridylyltransferase [Chloroflexota bacterium]
MSELRWNPVLGEWVMTATHRQDRTFLPPRDFCPLCPTTRADAPTEIERAGFDVAVFENRFPSLSPNPPAPAVAGSELTPVRPSVGACEVVVYTPRHDATAADLSQRQLERLIAVWAMRTLALGSRPEVDYVYVFENKGEAIGVTLHHPHGQIYAYPFLPPTIVREAASAAEHQRAKGGCLWCALLEQEIDDGRRVVAQNEHWLAGVPFFARWPYEIHLTPRRHVGWLHELDGEAAAALARLLKVVMLKYDRLFGFSLPYIMAIHQRPTDGGDHDGYHLHLEFYPPNRTATKLKYLAGSEAGAGAFINDTLPEETAPRLRELEPRAD